MMHKSKTLVALAMTVLVLFSAVSLFAGTAARKGTAGATELLIPVGSKATALGGNFTAGVTGIEAMFWNPAGLAASDQMAEAMASYMNYIADINVNYVAVAAKFGTAGTFGFSMKSFDFGEIPVTTALATDGTGETYSPSYTTLSASFSRAMTDRIFFGVTTKLVSEEIMNTSAKGVAFDFGVQYVFRPGLKMGVALKNLGSAMKFSGNDLERRVDMPGYVEDPINRQEDLSIIAQQFEIPTTMDIGLSYTMSPMESHNVTVMGNFRNHHFGLDTFGAGVEYCFKTEQLAVSLRGSASMAHDAEEGEFILQDENNIFGPAFGGGIFYKLGANMNVSFDYAYQMAEFFDNRQWFTLTLGF